MVFECAPPKFDSKDYRVNRAKQIFSSLLDDSFASNPDDGVRVVEKPRESCEYVETVDATKSLLLIPWNPVVLGEASKGTKCEPLQTAMGKFNGETIKVKPSSSLPKSATDMANTLRATCVFCVV